MPLKSGAAIGPYTVTAKIGEGGMGEVYQARDTKLDRDVALKVLPEAFTADPDRLARFEREAKVLASLNHPNIGSIYGLEEAEGVRALVLELIEGPTLANRIKQGPIPIDEALPIAKQVAEALEAAHEAGVIHRDLKPANIKVRDDGTVKVLDFGLAKALDTAPAGDPDQSPTLTAAATQMGVILGTAAYMSPEQARGKPVDKRADIWAFGVVLYEILSGARPFRGEDVSLTLASVMKSEVDVHALPSELSPTVRTVIRQCLQKDPARRIRDIGDVQLALEGVFEAVVPSSTPEGEASPRVRWWTVVPWILAILFAGAAAVALWRLPPTAPVAVERFVVSDPARPPTVQGLSPDVSISADGRKIVYLTDVSGARQIVVRDLGDVSPTLLTVPAGAANGAILSPDGESIAFFRQGGELVRIAARGGPAKVLTDVPLGSWRGAHWASDDSIVFATTGVNAGLWRIAASGGAPERLTKPEGNTAHAWPHLIPDAELVLFTTLELRQGGQTVETASVSALSLRDGVERVLIPGGFFPQYLPSGVLVFAVPGALQAVRLDLDRIEVMSSPITVAGQVLTKQSGAASAAISSSGSLVHIVGEHQEVTNVNVMTWVRPDDQTNYVLAPFASGVHRSLEVAPDGSRVVVGMNNGGGEFHIWVYDIGRGSSTRVTPSGGIHQRPVWTPDGEAIVYASGGRGDMGLMLARLDGSEPRSLLAEPGVELYPSSFTSDGETLLFHRQRPEGVDIGYLSIADPTTTLTYVGDSGYRAASPVVSPDGNWVAYHTDRSGEQEVFVGRFPDLSDPRPVSVGGGMQPIWTKDGASLLYRSPDSRQFFRVPVTSGPASLDTGTPELLFEGDYRIVSDPNVRSYDWDDTTQRLLAVERRSRVGDALLVQNWAAEIERLLAPD